MTAQHLYESAIAQAGVNRNWTFAHSKDVSGQAGQILRHLITALAGLTWASLAIWLAALVLPAYLANMVAIAVTFAWNFTASRLWVWPS